MVAKCFYIRLINVNLLWCIKIKYADMSNVKQSVKCKDCRRKFKGSNDQQVCIRLNDF